VVLGLLEAAVRERVRKNGKTPMGTVVRKAFGFFPSP
jgi:hypothetical protein